MEDSTVRDGGATLALFGLALFGLALFGLAMSGLAMSGLGLYNRKKTRKS